MLAPSSASNRPLDTLVAPLVDIYYWIIMFIMASYMHGLRVWFVRVGVVGHCAVHLLQVCRQHHVMFLFPSTSILPDRPNLICAIPSTLLNAASLLLNPA